MSILSTIFARNPDDDFWFTRTIGVESLAGSKVTADNALTVMAVYSAVRLLAETIATTPIITYQKSASGARARITAAPSHRLFHGQANRNQTSFEFKEMMMGHLALRGNAYAQIVVGEQSGEPVELIPLHPGRMEVFRLNEFDIGYAYQQHDGQKRAFTRDEIFHLRGLSSNGLTGLSPIDLMQEAVGTAMAAEGYAARFFKNGAAPGGFLRHPKQLSTPAHTRLKEWFLSNHQGWANAHNPAILEEGLEWTAVGIEPEKAQLLLTRQFQVTEIARAFRIQPHLIGDLTRSTNNNIEQQSLEFVTYTMMSWFTRWEERVGADFVMDQDTVFVEFLLDNLLRGDTLSRFTAYGMAIDKGFMTRNEARLRENLNPIDGLDRPLTPLNMTEAAQFVSMIKTTRLRIIRKEQAAMETAVKRANGDAQKLKDQISAFYDPFARFVAEVLCIEEKPAEAYAMFQKHRFLSAADNNEFGLVVSSLSDEWLAHFIDGGLGDETQRLQ